MSSDWKEFVLSDLFEFASGLSKNSKEFGFGSPFLSFKTVFNNYFIPDKLNELANTTQVEQEKCSIKKGDVFLTRTSETMNELGMSCVALKDYPLATFNGFTKRLRPKEKNIIYPLFAGYYFRSPFFRNAINSMAIMTTRASLNNEILSKLPMLLPPYETQENIGKILFNLDKKIHINQQMNRTLEAIGQAIFRHWFVHYEFPDENGQPYKSSGGEMVDSELGEIPVGWEVGTLGELISITSGKRPNEKSEEKTNEYKIPLIGASSVMGFVKESLYDEPILVIGRVGTHGVVQKIMPPSFPSDNTLVIKSEYYEFVYQILKKIDYDSLNVGTTQPLITQKSIKNTYILISTPEILKKFEDITLSLFLKINQNNLENEYLSQIRDSILPKLMSGKIRVPMEANGK